MNWHHVDKKYGLDHPARVTKPVSWLADQIIHSFVFLPTFDEHSRLTEILFNSDRTRRKHLHSISVDEIVALFEEIGADYPPSMRSRFNESAGDYDVHLGPGMEADKPGV